MGTNRLRFHMFGLVVVGAHTVGSLLWVVGSLVGFPAVRVVVLYWPGLGKGRIPAWVVWGDMGEGFGYPVGSSSDETEPDVTFPAFGSERRSRGGIGPDPDPIGHRCGIVTRRMPHPHPGGQRPDSRVQHLGQIRNLIRSGVTPPQPSSERLPRPVREAIHRMEPVLVVISRRGARFVLRVQLMNRRIDIQHHCLPFGIVSPHPLPDRGHRPGQGLQQSLI